MRKAVKEMKNLVESLPFDEIYKKKQNKERLEKVKKRIEEKKEEINAGLDKFSGNHCTIGELIKTENGCDEILKNYKSEPGIYFVGYEGKISDLQPDHAEKLEFKKIAKTRGEDEENIYWYGEDPDWEHLDIKKSLGEHILYIGKADDLYERISTYMAFVYEMLKDRESDKTHRGGRAICLLGEEAKKLDFYWYSLKELGLSKEDCSAEDLERELIGKYGQIGEKRYKEKEKEKEKEKKLKSKVIYYPFANWRL